MTIEERAEYAAELKSNRTVQLHTGRIKSI